MASTSKEQDGWIQNARARVLPVTSRKRKEKASWGFSTYTARNVLNLAAFKYLETTDASNGFVHYLKKRNVEIVDVQAGSLIITVKCGSQQILDKLWNDYCAGVVNEMAHQYLVTKEILNELGLTEVKLTTAIPEKEANAYQKQLQDFSSGEVFGLLQTRRLSSNNRNYTNIKFFVKIDPREGPWKRGWLGFS